MSHQLLVMLAPSFITDIKVDPSFQDLSSECSSDRHSYGESPTAVGYVIYLSVPIIVNPKDAVTL
jgi:hypothetical protein